jgi:hypothetical protein
MATAIILILLVLALIPVAAVILCALVDRAHLGADDSEIHP